MPLRPFPRAAPIRWLREVAPIRVKLFVGFGVSALLTGISLVLGWVAYRHAENMLGNATAVLEPIRIWLALTRFVIMVAAIAAGLAFARLIATPFVIIIERMEALSNGDLDSPIPFIHHQDCGGRIARAMHRFRDNAIARNAAADLNEKQSEELREANAKLEDLARDLTRALESAEQASRAKSRFLAGMSHELRTPLNGLLGYARLLRLDGNLTEMQDHRVDAMLSAGAHLLDMINRVLNLSEIESDRFAVKAARIDVRATAMECLDIVRPTAAIKGLALTLHADPDTPAELITDATRLRQVLLNLLGNAVKFTKAGSVEMRLGLGRGEAARSGSGTLRVEVVDTGPGIKQADRAYLFEEFERLQAAVTGAVEGSGLGLALSMRLAKILGGTIGHEDNPQGGSIFWLELPGMAAESLPAEPAPPMIEVLSEAAPRASQRRLRVLVVDDIKMNLEIAGAFLTADGHIVSFADGGAAAVALAAEQDFDVIVMDVRMPEIDGLEATRHIRAMPPPRGLVPIVAMTAQAFAEQVVECQLAGMNGHVTKPFAPEVLCAAVRDAAFPDPPDDTVMIADRAAAAESTCTAEQEKAAASPATTDMVARAVLVGPDAGAAPSGFDSAVFARMAGLLAPDILVSSLQTIGSRGSAFLKLARSGGSFESNMLPLAEMAHTLGGCAGMFGFARLANAAKRFEYAVQSNAPETGARAADLITAVEDAAAEIETHLARLKTETTQDQQADLPPATIRNETVKQRRAGAAPGVLIRTR